MSWMIPVFGVGSIALAVGVVHLYNLKTKNVGTTVRCLVFEQIGLDKVYIGESIAYETKDLKLGVYLHLKNRKVGISDIRNDDYFFDPKFGKCLLIVKYADDDYRIMSRMKSGEWYRKIKVADEDSEGKPITRDVYEPYKEALGVDQDSRTAMRFKRQFDSRQDEIYTDKKKGLEKWAPLVGLVMVGIVLMAGFMYMNNTHKQTMISISSDWTEEAEQYNSDGFFAGLTDWADRRTSVTDAPNI